MTLRVSLLAGASAALLSTAAFGQAGTEDEVEDQPATGQLAAAIDTVTVYGTTNPLPVFEYPGQVSVFTREDIETFAPSAISDLLRDAPGVEFSGGPRRTGEVPSIRGLGRENVLILLDGARQSFISAHDGRFFLDPELVKSAEVVRGPASSLYGSGAVGGVLAFETVDAADFLADGESVGARARVGYQDVNEETLAALTGYGRTGRLDVLASIGSRDSGDIALGSGATLPSDDDIVTALLKGELDVTDALRVEASWQRFDNDAVEPNNGQGATVSSDPTLGAIVEKDITTDNLRGALAFDPNSRAVDARLTVYSTQTDVDEFDASTGRRTIRDIDTTGVSVRNATRFDLFGEESILTVGGDWYRDEQVGTDNQSDDGTRQGVPNGKSEFYGVFAQLETRVPEPLGLPGELLLIPGARFDSYQSEADGQPDQNEDEAFSPRLAASYGPAAWFRVFGSYSEGFRAPSINELYLDGPHFPVPHPILFDQDAGQFVFVNNNFVANPELRPEKTETIEFGAGVDFHDIAVAGDRFQAKLSYHSSDVEDLINLFVDFSFAPTCFAPPFFPCNAGTTESENVANAELDGWEAEAIYQGGGFQARASFSTIDGEDVETGDKLGVLTPARFALDASYGFWRDQLRLGSRLQLADDFDKVNDPALARDGYAVVDLYAVFAPEFLEGVRIDAGLDNVFDEDYERVFAGVSEPGTNARIAISYSRGF